MPLELPEAFPLSQLRSFEHILVHRHLAFQLAVKYPAKRGFQMSLGFPVVAITILQAESKLYGESYNSHNRKRLR
ncbi:hypothetical protein SAMN05660420_03108 [Desulfuromusa kysingii]|uniref:Uncharacterized protein n=1 Tax=Desulfuromusa kysingii TaxID=37625 RepID=A0A1H4DWD8_9BACT|nr:hypothetical protein SAMN05660420_03108 [Desulfuromusa kysingii]